MTADRNNSGPGKADSPVNNAQGEYGRPIRSAHMSAEQP